jgi:hypothetical protein
MGSYAGRMAYLLKRWVEPPKFEEKVDRAPRLSHLCEGCRRTYE